MSTEKDIISKVIEVYDSMAEDEESIRWSDVRKRFSTISKASEFFVQCMLNQGQDASFVKEKAEFFISEYFPGENIWQDIANMHKARLKSICKKGYYGGFFALHFQANKFHIWLKENAKIMHSKYEGDPRKIWNGIEAHNCNEIYRRLREFSGIGDALAKMMTFILVRKYGVAGGSETKHLLCMKPDIHIQRVCYRLGLIDEISTRAVKRWEREAKLDSPVDFDLVIWRTGRNYCKALKPKCKECPLTKVCAKRK